MIEYSRYIEEIAEWNKVANRGFIISSNESFIKQNNYIKEEIFETIAAIANGDLVETVDGLVDSLVTLGYKWKMQNPNLKYEDFNKIPVYIKRLSRAETIRLLSNIIYDELESDAGDLIQTTEQSLGTLLGIMDNYGSWAVDMEGAIKEVLRSNWSKYPKFESILECELECNWIQINRNKENVTFSLYEDRVVYRDSTGKIAKPSSFAEPQLAQYIG